MANCPKYLQFTEFRPCQNSTGSCDVVSPDPRSGHRIVVSRGNIYSVGGYNPDVSDRVNESDTHFPLFKELWRFNFASRQWIKLKTSGSMPDALASHTALLHGNYIVVFGGTGVPFGEAASNQLYVCNLSTMEWTHIKCSGQLPICLYGHTLTLCGRALFLFGGTTGWEYNSDLHRLDLDTCTWSAVPVSGACPPGRYRHEVACLNKDIFIFGGGRSNVVYGFETLPAINTDTGFWTTRVCYADISHGFPAARRCHSCVQLDQDVYVCGGYNGEVIFDDLWVINLDQLQWMLLPTRLPQPVYFHSAAVTEKGLMVLHGGVVQIDSRRTSKIFAIWLRVAPLKELCWQTVLNSVPNIASLPKQSLLNAGIPLDLVERVD